MVLRAAAAAYTQACLTGMAGTPLPSEEAFGKQIIRLLGVEKAHQKAMGKAADIGTHVHSQIEKELRLELGLPEATGGKKISLSTEQLAAAKQAFEQYQAWKSEKKFKPRVIERVVYSETYGYAGTMDVLGTANLQNDFIYTDRFCGDWKTSSRIWFSAHLQVAAYRHAWLEMNPDERSIPLHGLVLRLPKTPDDPTFEPRFISEEEMKANFKTFLSVMEVWKEAQAYERRFPYRQRRAKTDDTEGQTNPKRKVRRAPKRDAGNDPDTNAL